MVPLQRESGGTAVGIAGSPPFLEEELSGATMVARPAGQGAEQTKRCVFWPRRLPVLRTLVIATALPIGQAIEPFPLLRRCQPDTMSGYVVVVGEISEVRLDLPSVVAIRPRRQRLLSPSGLLVPLLPRRRPFISASTGVLGEE